MKKHVARLFVRIAIVSESYFAFFVTFGTWLRLKITGRLPKLPGTKYEVRAKEFKNVQLFARIVAILHLHA